MLRGLVDTADIAAGTIRSRIVSTLHTTTRTEVKAKRGRWEDDDLVSSVMPRLTGAGGFHDTRLLVCFFLAGLTVIFNISYHSANLGILSKTGLG